jgi:hypothetical protein
MKKVLVSTAALLLVLVITGAAEAAERGKPHGGSYRRQPSTRQTGPRLSTDGGRLRDAYSGTYPGRSGLAPPSTRGDDKGKRPTTHQGRISGSGQDENHGKKDLEDLKKGRLARKDPNRKAKQNRNKMTMNMAAPGGTGAAGDMGGGQSGGGQSGGSGSPTGSGDSGSVSNGGGTGSPVSSASASNGGDTGSPVSSTNLVVADNSGGAAGPRGPADASGPGNSSSSKDSQEQGGRQEQESSAGRETSGSEQTPARKAPVDSEKGGSKAPSKDGSREY